MWIYGKGDTSTTGRPALLVDEDDGRDDRCVGGYVTRPEDLRVLLGALGDPRRAQAAADLGFDLASSALIGDQGSDGAAALAAGPRAEHVLILAGGAGDPGSEGTFVAASSELYPASPDSARPA